MATPPVAALVPFLRTPQFSAPQPTRRGDFQAVLARTRTEPSRPGAVASDTSLQRTPLTASQAEAALGEAWKELRGTSADPSTLRLITAQWSHETGGGKSMFNHNFGGIKGVSSEGLSTVARTREGQGASERVIYDRFRAYSSPQEGALDYLRLLSRRYPAALEQAAQGNSAGFVHELKQAGYFTGSEEAYTRSVARLAGEEGVQSDGIAALSAANHAPRRIGSASSLPNPGTWTPATEGLGDVRRDLPPEQAVVLSFLTAQFEEAMSRSSMRIIAEGAANTSEDI